MSTIIVYEKREIKQTEFRRFLFSADGVKFIKEIRKVNDRGAKLKQYKIEGIYNDLRVKLRLLKHTNIAQHLETYETPSAYIIVDKQYVTDLFELKHRRDFKPREILGISTQIIAGIAHMHKHKIIHCDLKLENLVVSSDGTIKIIDFEYARDFPPPGVYYKDFAGTDEYQSPEMRDEHWNMSVDIWCVGFIIDELNTIHYKHKKMKVSSQITDLTSKILKKRPCDRLGYINDDSYDVTKIHAHITKNFEVTPEITITLEDVERPYNVKTFEYTLPIDMPLVLTEFNLVDSSIETTEKQ